MKIKKELLKRTIGGENILIPLGKTVYDCNGMFALTETGAFIWDMLPQAESEEDIVKAFLAEYDVEEDVVRADVAEFMEKLRKLEVID